MRISHPGAFSFLFLVCQLDLVKVKGRPSPAVRFAWRLREIALHNSLKNNKITAGGNWKRREKIQHSADKIEG